MLMFLMSLAYANFAPNALLCLDNDGNILPINNSQVIEWKHNTPNQFLERGHVLGRITKIYPDKSGHDHFQVNIDGRDTIEFVYNEDFGGLPQLKTGMIAEGCGDYITSNVPTSKYPASPDGAILHWIHMSTGRHLHGFLKLNNNIYGTFNLTNKSI